MALKVRIFAPALFPCHFVILMTGPNYTLETCELFSGIIIQNNHARMLSLSDMLSNLEIVDFFLKLLELHFWRHANCSQGFPFKIIKLLKVGLCLFKGLRLLFLPSVPGATSIPDSIRFISIKYYALSFYRSQNVLG